MKRPTLTEVNPKTLLLDGLRPDHVYCLAEVPLILEERNSPRARERLFPSPIEDDAEWKATWNELVVPELETFFRSAEEIMTQDLAGIEVADAKGLTYRVKIPASHVNAWMSAINQARLILGAQHDITQQEMNELIELDPANPRHLVILKIEILAQVFSVFLHHETGEPEKT